MNRTTDSMTSNEPPDPAGAIDDGAVETLDTATMAGQQADEDDESELPPGHRLGRYVIVDVIGRGGMGVVYKAFDPKLGRAIAIKVTHTRYWSERGRARFLREAQAMAKLSHPHVLAVHDVGEDAGQIYIAMELVEGETFHEWLMRGHHTWSQILEIFLQAGRGLAAAHAAKLVHRDFKPANVLIDAHGRARILDFGVARLSSAEQDEDAMAISGDSAELSSSTSDAPPSTTGEDSRGSSELSASHDSDAFVTDSALATPLTHAGAVLGTPRYMAPEQRSGRSSAASDQYAFCVALREALYGSRKSSKTPRRRTNRLPACRGRVPRGIDRALARGLRSRPSRRFESMSALLAALEAVPRARRRRRLAAALAVGAAGLLAIGLAGRQAGTSDPCAGVRGEEIGVWSPAHAERIRKTLEGSGSSHASATAALVTRSFDDRSQAWRDMRVQACEATRVDGEQSDELMDRRMSCLDRRRDELRGLVETLASEPGKDVVDRAASAAASLPAIAECADREALMARAPLPREPERRARIAEIQRELADADALFALGQYKRAKPAVINARDAAILTDYGPLRARAEFLVGRLLRKSSEFKGAETAFYASANAAAATGDARREALAWLELAWLAGYDQERYGDSEILYRVAEVAIARAGAPPVLRAQYARGMGSLHYVRGKYPEAMALFAEALELGGDELPVALRAELLNDTGEAHRRLGNAKESRRYFEDALELQKQILADGHPELALYLSNLGSVLLEIDAAAAIEVLNRALAIRERALGRDHAKTAYTLLALGGALHKQRKFEPALEHTKEALRIWEKTLGDSHPNLSYPLLNSADILRDLGRCGEAYRHYRRGIAIFEKNLGPDYIMIANPLVGTAECLMSEGRARAALAPLARAMAIHAKSKGSVLDRANTEFAFARALVANKRSKERALTLARGARTAFAGASADTGADVARIDAWLAEQTAR